jgi:Flp pilus assembly pilin Flp
MKKIWKFIKDEEGLETPEYAVMGALIVVALVVAITTLRGSIQGVFENMAGIISGS